MGKLGKKARKFVKKKLPAVLKRQRKQKSLFNKRKSSSSRGEHNVVENQQTDATTTTTTGRKPLAYDLLDVSLDIFSSEENYDMLEQTASDTDEFLDEDSTCSYGHGIQPGLDVQDAELSTQNKKLLSQLLEKNKLLEALKHKDPQFVIFLQDHIKDPDSSDNEDMSDDEEASDQDVEPENDCAPISNTRKLLRSSTINHWCQMVKEQNKVTLLPSLINAYHTACHYGTDPTDVNVSVTPPIIQNKEAFYSILMFMLSEGDQLFRGILGISADCKMDAILRLKNSSKWENVKPMVKSYLKSSLFLLNQFTDTDILAYALSRLRASLIFFSVFPALQNKLIEVSVHLWATGSESLSACSFVVLRGIASFLGDDSYDKCLKKTYKAILSCSKIVSPARLKHLEYLKSSFVELCSIDFQISAKVVVASIQKLAKIVQLGLQTKEEALRMICSWEYVLCIDIWVNFVQSNIKDIDLHAILSTLIQVILGVAKLFAGQRYLPLKVKCVHWLNVLSSSENFVPTSSLALDILENSNAEEEGKTGKGGVDFSTALKIPKHWLKSQAFQEKSVLAAVELLSAHFLQWSHHISFPELATIPIIRLKQFHDKSTTESLCRTVKRLIDQVEKNVEFVQRKRDDVSFSPKDIASAELFLQMEKHSSNLPFIQYYKSVIENAATQKVSADDQMSRPEIKKQKAGKIKLPDKKDGSANGEKKAGNTAADPSIGREQGVKKKKRKA
ncbi:protein REBELOTE [Silene latifolia]|uniref:protein REBELOTE n=1 Tax=Silene latifolia TaxID=37657 RepID=UPI003D76F096